MKHKAIIAGVALLLISFLTASCSPGVSQEEYDRVSSELTQTQQELASTRSQLSKAQSDLEGLRKACPPGDFATLTELENWAKAHVQPTTTYVDAAFKAALKVQSAALGDGYLVSVNIDYDQVGDSYVVSCSAITGDCFYAWFPEDPSGAVYPWGASMCR